MRRGGRGEITGEAHDNKVGVRKGDIKAQQPRRAGVLQHKTAGHHLRMHPVRRMLETPLHNKKTSPPGPADLPGVGGLFGEHEARLEQRHGRDGDGQEAQVGVVLDDGTVGARGVEPAAAAGKGALALHPHDVRVKREVKNGGEDARGRRRV